MTRHMRARIIIWAAVILAMLVGAYVVVARNGSSAQAPAAAEFMH